MADERHYIVRCARGFDGTTDVAITNAWLPLPQDQAHQKLRSVDLGNIFAGRFTPEVLGRPGKGISLVRVFTDGTYVSGDRYSSVGSATAVNSSGIIEADPTSTNRGVSVILGVGPAAARAIELGPTDDLIVYKGIGVAAEATIHIIVNDLDEGEVFDWTVYNNTVIDSADTTETRSITVTAGPVDIGPWAVDTLFVEARATTAGGSLRLPARATVAVGTRLRLARTDGLLGGEHFVLIAGGVGETINGSTFPILFNADAQGVWIEPDANGWLATTAPVNTNSVALSGTQTITRSSRLRTLVEWTATPSDSILTLPPIAQMGVDQEIEVVCVANAGAGGVIVPTTGEQIDSVIDKQLPVVRKGDVWILRRVGTGGWLSYYNGNPLNRDTFAIVADPALGTSVGWDGLRHYRGTYGAPGNFTLPTAPRLGTEIVVSQSNANAITLQAGGNVIIAGGTAVATLALSQNVPIHLRFFTGAWVQV